MNKLLKLAAAFILSAAFCRCQDATDFPTVPEIKFNSLEFTDIIGAFGSERMAVLSFDFFDGDGDLGVREANPNDTISRIYYSWFRKPSETDDDYSIYYFPDSTTLNYAEIPWGEFMDKSTSQNKSLKGTINIQLNPPRQIAGIDSMYVLLYIIDRANNKSNEIHSPPIFIANPEPKYE